MLIQKGWYAFPSWVIISALIFVFKSVTKLTHHLLYMPTHCHRKLLGGV